MVYRLLHAMESALRSVAFEGNDVNKILDSLDTMDGRCSDVPIAGRSTKTPVETRGTIIADSADSPVYRGSNKSLTARLLGQLQGQRWLERLAAARLVLSLVPLLGPSLAQRCLNNDEPIPVANKARDRYDYRCADDPGTSVYVS